MGQIISFDNSVIDEFYDELWCPQCGGAAFALRIYPEKDMDVLKVKCLNKECNYTAELIAQYK